MALLRVPVIVCRVPHRSRLVGDPRKRRGNSRLVNPFPSLLTREVIRHEFITFPTVALKSTHIIHTHLLAGPRNPALVGVLASAGVLRHRGKTQMTVADMRALSVLTGVLAWVIYTLIYILTAAFILKIVALPTLTFK